MSQPSLPKITEVNNNDGLVQVAAQLDAEKAALLAKKRHQQTERKRKQEELDRILQENKRKVGSCRQAQVLQMVCSCIISGTLARFQVEEAQQRATEERKRREEEK